MKTFPFIVLLIACGLTVVRGAELSPDDSRVRYLGRFDRTDAAGPRCAWTASSVTVAISGGSLSVKLKDGGKNVWQVIVNGQPAGVLALQAGEQTYPVVTGLPAGRHVVELFKRTEAQQGVTQVLGFQLEGGEVRAPEPARKRRIEVIGDSISCGYGNEAPGKEHNFSAATENGWLAYGAVAARAVNADYVCVAWSGKKLWPNNSIIDYYDRVLPEPGAKKWDFATWAPDVVIINLGTNDFRGKTNPDEAGWVAAYVEFIKRIRATYPKASIYCALGTMLSNWPEDRRPRATILGYFQKVIDQTNAAGGPPVRFIDFGVQKAEHGYGANWHPSVKTHELMATKLTGVLKTDLGW
ncbi:MAG: acetylxylan esterase [Rariglobus sp.]|jgi:lysophospholipase L1-like esterase|nr:acetylxylan esterase [Rariglobus sp.]